MNTLAVLLALCSLVCLNDAYPLLSMPQFPASKYEGKVKRNNEGFPLTDDDVLQLENLKRNENQNQHDTVISSTIVPKIQSTAEQLPDLEYQLELATPNSADGIVNQQKQAIHKSQEHIIEHQATAETSTAGAVTSAGTPIIAKAAERLLQHRNGEYSAFDMAQYVFWTGDESGVARAVEELIERGLMTRENALKFLREIRMGIEYLERSYDNRVMPTDLRQNHIKKTYTIHPRLMKAPSTTTEHMAIGTEKPIKAFVPLWHSSSRPFDSAATWSKLQELNANEAVVEPNDYDEASGRAKIAEFLYTEYTLEEILYKLAKVMFTQSLAHGSDEAQKELQKLTDFLEREGNLGVIPIDLQKKVLNTLLTALSDTLSEHPELLPAARSNLGMQYNKIVK